MHACASTLLSEYSFFLFYSFFLPPVNSSLFANTCIQSDHVVLMAAEQLTRYRKHITVQNVHIEILDKSSISLSSLTPNRKQNNKRILTAPNSKAEHKYLCHFQLTHS